MFDVGMAVNYFSRPLKIKRASAGGYDENGKALPSEDAVQPLMGSIQPMRGQDLRSMPEGVREEAHFILSTTGEVKNDDIIIDCDAQYRVCWRYPATLGQYTRAALGLLENQRAREDVEPFING